MLGWINDCVEKLVLEKYGENAWKIIKQKAHCTVPNGGFYKLEHYSDASTMALLNATCDHAGMSMNELMEAFGAFFTHYIRGQGYETLLCCQGSTLKDWMSNINAIHHHLQTTFPKKMTMPEFWCEDSATGDGSLVLHYHSQRGNIFADLAKGLVVEVAKFQFKLDILLERFQTQGENDSKVTSWRITTKNPEDLYKLTTKVGENNGVENAPTSFKCPFTGMTARRPSSGSLHGLGRTSSRRSLGNLLQATAAASGSETRGSSNQQLNVPTRASTKGFKAIRSAHGSNGSLAGLVGLDAGSSGNLSFAAPSNRPITRVQSGPSLLMNAGFLRKSSNGSDSKGRRRSKNKPSSALLQGIKQQLLGSKQQQKPDTMQPQQRGSMKSRGSLSDLKQQLVDSKQQMLDAMSIKSNGTMTDKLKKAAATITDPYSVQPQRCPLSDTDSSDRQSPPLSEVRRQSSFHSVASSLCGSEQVCLNSQHVAEEEDDDIGLSGAVLKSLHPYHIILNQDFQIVQVGNSLPSVLKKKELDIAGQSISDVFDIAKPVGMAWTWKWLTLIEEQSFVVVPTTTSDSHPELTKLCFKTTAVHVQEYPPMVMLLMTPDANNLAELRDMSLTLSDVPVHGAHRDAVFLREHLSTQMNNALSLEKMTKSLEQEKQLLERLLPSHAADHLRRGATMEPMTHKDVTLFFSDVVGFTSISKELYPWQVIEMINKLYLVMDHIAIKFGLFKCEIIGDAYICCSGLPKPDKDHAKKVANFAIAVIHACKHVLSPVDGKPLQLRIGLNTGSCASGIVGAAMPRYTVFGDTVNVTARHESSGVPGKIHISETCKDALQEHAGFKVTERGLIEMKGKGEMRTYFLEVDDETNRWVSQEALAKLDEEIVLLLNDESKQVELSSRRRSVNVSALNSSMAGLNASVTSATKALFRASATKSPFHRPSESLIESMDESWFSQIDEE